jgi:hypothetical protein
VQLKEEEDTRQDQIKHQSSGIGGYHSVNIPLSESAKSDLNKFKVGTVNFLQLVSPKTIAKQRFQAIADSKSEIISAGLKSVQINELANEINELEPRFYLYNYQKIGATAPISGWWKPLDLTFVSIHILLS